MKFNLLNDTNRLDTESLITNAENEDSRSLVIILSVKIYKKRMIRSSCKN